MIIIDKEFQTQLNFTDEFNLSRNGMINEIKTEFDVIRLCIAEQNTLSEKYYTMLDRLLVMPLRKLLCEKESVLLNVCPDFRMPHIDGFVIDVMNSHFIIRPPFSVEPFNLLIPVAKWLEQNISWFDRSIDDVPTILPKFSYEGIQRKLNSKKYKVFKSDFEALYYAENAEYRGQISETYFLKNSADVENKKKVFDILNQIGYNKLTIFDFIKHLSDKRGAHIDIGHSLVVEMINRSDVNGFTPVHYLALQMIYAAKKQIIELADYWADMPDLIM